MMIKKGDTIGILALAGTCKKKDIDIAVSNLTTLGYKVKLAQNIYNKNNYLAGTDKEKVESIHQFFLDKDVKLILNARGGYGSIRLIHKIDYNIIKSNPKPFCGFSDITALLLMLYKKTGLTTYHSPMLCSDFIQIEDYTIQNFFKTINKQEMTFFCKTTYKAGYAEGILWGGNLSTIVSLCGQDFIPDENFIFFTEDLNEPTYKIDRMFTQLFNIDKFKQNCKAILIGDFLNIDNQEWLKNLFYNFNIPTIGGLEITHSTRKITLPIGKNAMLNNNILSF